MKKNLLLGGLLLLATLMMAVNTIDNAFFDKVTYRGAFGTTDWTKGWSNFDCQNTAYGATTVTVAAGDITTNTTWTKNNVYLLNGWVYVKSGATLTIEAGTLIRGDKTNKAALIIEKGAKLIANGTLAEPIVFTSNQPAGGRTYGDWGGVILCGQAPINPIGGTATIEGGVGSTYGGSDEADNSGSLKYIRIEFAGIAFALNNEINGLTCGGVGSGTTIDYVQVSYSGDDSFEWFGGTVNCKHLIAYRGWDDEFDTDFGYSGMVQYAVGLRDPAVADQSQSNGFESDNNATGDAVTPYTSAIFSNVSLFGPLVTPTTTINSLFRRAAHIRRNSKLQVYNTVFAGWPIGVYIDGISTQANAVAGDLKVRNSVLSGMTTNIDVPGSQTWDMAAATTWYNTPAFKNALYTANTELGVVDPFNLAAPKFTLTQESPLNTNSYWYQTNTTKTIDNSFFDQVTYRGAFGTTDWTKGWSNFDCQNTAYGATTVTVAAGDITTNTTWTKNNVYLLNGWVYVKSGATLTIEAGTLIRGDKTNKAALIIEKGAKLIANGTLAEPIVFTSNQPAGGRTYGDWGGVILCGQAPINPIGGTATIEGGVGSTYGGSDEADNSGSLKYIRIEFAGIAFALNNEINGLTCGGVGSGTTIDYVQVSYSGDDSFEWFGGTVNCKHLIAYRGWDDEFDTDFGYSGMVQYAVGLRDPAVADQSQSNGFESDNNATGDAVTPYTSAIFSNVSLFGPLVTPTTTINSLFRRAAHIRRNSKLQVYNTVFAGWPIGVYIDGISTQANAVAGDLKVRNSVLSGMTTNIDVPGSQTWDMAAATTWYNTPAFKNALYTANTELGVVDPFNLAAPKFNLTAGSVLNTKSYWDNATGIFTPAAVQNSLTIYPNPATSELTVVLPFENNSKVNVSIVDVTGREVYSKQNISVETETINVSNLSKGIYLVIAKQGDMKLTQKLFISK